MGVPYRPAPYPGFFLSRQRLTCLTYTGRLDFPREFLAVWRVPFADLPSLSPGWLQSQASVPLDATEPQLLDGEHPDDNVTAATATSNVTLLQAVKQELVRPYHTP